MKVIDQALMDSLTQQAKDSERLRAHYNLHESLDEDIHRLLIATEPGTYFQPHRHFSCDKWELFTLLRGSGIVFTFNPEGVVTNRYEMGDDSVIKVLEIPAETLHCFLAIEEGTVFMEVKRGPYMKPSGDDWGSWAPAEGDKRVPAFMAQLKAAQPGDQT
jgi:cupin fold WbuC family metalloprotein